MCLVLLRVVFFTMLFLLSSVRIIKKHGADKDCCEEYPTNKCGAFCHKAENDKNNKNDFYDKTVECFSEYPHAILLLVHNIINDIDQKSRPY